MGAGKLTPEQRKRLGEVYRRCSECGYVHDIKYNCRNRETH